LYKQNFTNKSLKERHPFLSYLEAVLLEALFVLFLPPPVLVLSIISLLECRLKNLPPLFDLLSLELSEELSRLDVDEFNISSLDAPNNFDALEVPFLMPRSRLPTSFDDRPLLDSDRLLLLLVLIIVLFVCSVSCNEVKMFAAFEHRDIARADQRIKY